MKLSVLLAKTDHTGSQFKELVKDYHKFFESHQGQFKGVRKTYTPKEGTIDDPNMRSLVKVVTTVDEKLNWLEDVASEHIDNLFSLEATNAANVAKAHLVVGGVDFGMLSSLELLRLKSFVESGELDNMYSKIPVRSDAENWSVSSVEGFDRPGIFAQELEKGTKKGIFKETIILVDPNAQYTGGKHAPVTGTKDTVVEYGDYTLQKFSGEWSHAQRAELLKRKSALLVAIKAALEEANTAEQVNSTITGKKLFDYLHRGK